MFSKSESNDWRNFTYWIDSYRTLIKYINTLGVKISYLNILFYLTSNKSISIIIYSLMNLLNYDVQFF